MASLWWSSSRYTLSQAAEDIGEVLQGIEQGLPGLGYTGVQLAQDVHGFKGHYILAVQYLFIANRDFWQVIACGGNGGTEAEAQSYMQEVRNLINKLTFL